MHHNVINNNTRRKTKSTEDMNVGECYCLLPLLRNAIKRVGLVFGKLSLVKQYVHRSSE